MLNAFGVITHGIRDPLDTPKLFFSHSYARRRQSPKIDAVQVAVLAAQFLMQYRLTA
jgi:hypothetical protein